VKYQLQKLEKNYFLIKVNFISFSLKFINKKDIIMKIQKWLTSFIFASLVLVACSDDGDSPSGPADPVYSTGSSTFGDATGNDVIYGIEPIAGGFLLVGNTETLNNGSSSDGLVMQVDLEGNVAWESTVDSGNNDYDRFYDVELAADGNIIAAGFGTVGSSDTDMMLAVMTSGGSLTNISLVGTTSRERAYSVGDWSSFSAYMMAGYNSETQATVQYIDSGDFSDRGADIIDLETSSVYRGIKTGDNLIVHVGDILVNGQYDGMFTAVNATDGVYLDDSPGKVISSLASRLYGINNTPSNRAAVVICGTSDSGNGYIAKANTSGDLVWETTTSEIAVLWSVMEDSMGNVVAVGWSGTDAIMVKTDSQGQITLTKTFNGTANGTDRFFGVAESENGEYVMVGSTAVSSDGTSSGWMVRTTPEGN